MKSLWNYKIEVQNKHRLKKFKVNVASLLGISSQFLPASTVYASRKRWPGFVIPPRHLQCFFPSHLSHNLTIACLNDRFLIPAKVTVIVFSSRVVFRQQNFTKPSCAPLPSFPRHSLAFRKHVRTCTFLVRTLTPSNNPCSTLSNAVDVRS